MAGCGVLLAKEDIGVTKFIHQCTTIPPLMELAARALHCVLKGEFGLLSITERCTDKDLLHD